MSEDSVLFIVNVDVLEPLAQLPNSEENVESGSQSAAADSACVSSLIFVKSFEVKLSVIFQVIVEPCGTDAVTEVSVAPMATETFPFAVV